MRVWDRPSELQREAYGCAFRLWYVIAAVSVILFQLPLYYVYKNSLMSLSEPYWPLFLHFMRNWCILMALSLLGCLSAVRAVRGFYEPYWSVFGIKLAAFLSLEFIAAVVVLVYFALVYNKVLFPVYVVVGVTMLSAGISASLCSMNRLRTLLYERACEME